jgi:hypothetical protein
MKQRGGREKKVTEEREKKANTSLLTGRSQKLQALRAPMQCALLPLVVTGWIVRASPLHTLLVVI